MEEKAGQGRRELGKRAVREMSEPGRAANGKRLLYLIGSKDPGGAEKVLSDLAVNFQGKGYGVTVAHLGNPWLSRELEKTGIREICLPFANWYSAHRTEWLFVLHLMDFFKAQAFDLVHAHLFGMILYASIAGRALKTPVLGTIHDKYYFREREHRRLAYRIVQILGCKLVTVSEDIKEDLSRRWGVKRDKIVTVPNGIDLTAFDRSVDRARKRREFGLAPDDLVAICVGRLVKMKGHSILVEAAKKVVNQNRKIKFLVVGDGPEREELGKRTSTEGIAENVIFTGLRDDVPELLLASDLFVQTSYTEGLSCTVLEALGAGCPAVVTDVGGNKEIIRDGKEGYLIPIADPSGLEKKILSLAESPEVRAELGKNARERAKTFSLGSMVQNYEHLYLDLFPSR